MKYVLKKAAKKDYIEIGQQKKVLFSFCNKKGNVLKQLFSPVLCRDFLSDVLVAEEWNKKVSRYAFVYNPARTKIDRDKTRLLLTINDEDKNNLINNLDILHEIEHNNKLIRTEITHVDDNTLLVEGSKVWLNSTFSLHLYTFLLKAISYEYEHNWFEELKDKETNEANYARSLTPSFLKIINSNIKSIFRKGTTVHGYNESPSLTFLHDNGGVVTLFGKGVGNVYKVANNEYYKRLTKFL